MDEEVVILPLASVLGPKEINPREDYKNERRIISMMQHLDTLPPMVAFNVPGRGLLLSSGYHRFEAHERAGQKEGRFIILQGTLDDAIDFAVTDNLGPLPLTPEQQRLAIENWLKRHPEQSDQKIAFNLYISSRDVAITRKRLEKQNEIAKWKERQNVKGIWQPVRTSETRPYGPRKKPHPKERLKPCQYCNYPVSTGHHPFDWAEYGETEITIRVCYNCHDLCHIINNALQAFELNTESNHNYNLLGEFIHEWGSDSQLLFRVGMDVAALRADRYGSSPEQSLGNLKVLLRRLEDATRA